MDTELFRQIMAWVFGLCAMASLFLVYQQKKRSGLLFCKLCADISWVGHYFCLGAYTGMVPNFVGIFRELIFIHREKRKWANCVLFPILFILLNWALGLRTVTAPIGFLPLVASSFVTVSLWLKNPRLTKILSAPVSLSFLIYDIFVCSYIGVINESLSILSIILSFIRERKHKI